MPQIKSQIKRVLTNEKRAAAVKARKSTLRTAIKTLENAVNSKEKELAKNAYNNVAMLLDKCVVDHIYHQNYANRKKSHLAKLLNTLE